MYHLNWLSAYIFFWHIQAVPDKFQKSIVDCRSLGGTKFNIHVPVARGVLVLYVLVVTDTCHTETLTVTLDGLTYVRITTLVAVRMNVSPSKVLIHNDTVLHFGVVAVFNLRRILRVVGCRHKLLLPRKRQKAVKISCTTEACLSPVL